MMKRIRRFLPPLLMTLAAMLAIALCASAQSDAASRTSDTFHVVREGETLQTISKHYFGTTRRWQQIYKLNREQLSAPEGVEPGMRLKISVATGKPTTHGIVISPAAVARAASQEASREPPKRLPASEGPGALVDVRVQPGDTVDSLAERHMGSRKFWSRIMELNSRKLRDPEDLKPGMVIQVQEFEPRSNPARETRSPASVTEKYAATDTTETLEISAAASVVPPTAVPAAVPIAAPAGLPHFEDFVDP